MGRNKRNNLPEMKLVIFTRYFDNGQCGVVTGGEEGEGTAGRAGRPRSASR